ncbi:MAG: DUF4129 domain-containing protein [Actinomycetota bacterium]
MTKKILVVGAFCLLFSPAGVFAKNLAEYHKSLNSAKEWTQRLIDYVHEVAENENLEDIKNEREILGGIRQNLPITEKVEWEGTSIETNNQWLEAKLKAFEDEKDWPKRRLILTAISERLSALEKKISQLENPSVSDRSKDEDKRKLAEILRRAEYQKPPEQEESWFQKMVKRIRAWFSEKFPRPDIPEGASEGLQSVSFGMQMLLYAALFGFIAFLIYRFAPFFARKFRRREKEDKGERVILGEKLAANEDAQSLFSEAEDLARNGNLRGAIRKGYIALLCELSDRKIIGLAQHKTNRDYLRDVRKKRELHQNMNGLTTSFERHWYGFDDADEADWNEFKQTYQKAISNEN